MSKFEYVRDRIWKTFRPGQEQTKTPSREYVEAARAVRDWIEANHPTPLGPML